jgi:C-terminal processing protease CtpA/Prc
VRRLLAAALAACLAACGSDRPSAPTQASPTAPTTISTVAQQHLDQLFTIMQNNSIKRLTIDWSSLRSEVFAAAGAAQTIPDTFPAIRLALTRIGDGHSSYRPANGSAVIFVATRPCTGSGGASKPSLPDSIGYVSVGSFAGTPAEAITFANAIQTTIRDADRDGLAGWIVDLRGNGGGNMWPMIAGVGPVLGEGLLGFFIAPTGTTTAWEYRDGASWSGSNLGHRVDNPYRLRRDRPRVAVLTDVGVASSGEATVVAFRQRPDTRSFGVATCGLSTANSPFNLADGAVLNLTVAVMADRTRTSYGDRIEPDEVIADRTELVTRAVAWLQTGQ